MTDKKCSMARQFLVMKWMLVGFLLSISYKSVLRALLIKVEYENTINTIDDMLESERTLMIPEDTPIKYILETDPREKVKLLSKEAQFYKFGTATPEWVIEGYFLLKCNQSYPT